MANLCANSIRVFVVSAILLASLASEAGTADAESPSSKPMPQGWISDGSHPSEYEMGVDKTVTHEGTASGFIKSGSENLNGFGTLMQMFRANKFKGKKVQLTCWTKTENVVGWAGVWMRVDGEDAGHPLSFDNMQDRPIKGTTDWTKRKITLDVPAESVNIAFGILLYGAGSAWVDDFEFREVGTATHTEQKKHINADALNLNFEDTK